MIIYTIVHICIYIILFTIKYNLITKLYYIYIYIYIYIYMYMIKCVYNNLFIIVQIIMNTII